MATKDRRPATRSEPELHLLLANTTLDEPLWSSLRQNIQDYFFPKKQPPLLLTSTPIPAREVWGFYDHKKTGALASTVVHILALAAIIGVTIVGRRMLKKEIQTPHTAITWVAPYEAPALPPAKTQAGGGGGGGDHDKFQASKGRLPKLAMEQITPPAVVVRSENPKLTAEPTVVVPPQIHMAMNHIPTLGDPLSHLPSGPPSNGVGSGGGIGSGSGTGVGVGRGPGVGPGYGGGTGDGPLRVGGAVSAPRPISTPDPEYSDEARKAKYQGTCVLWMIVGPDGKPREIRVARTLGLGLDEKAVEAVKQWTFEPAMKDGHPVAVQINVEVSFRLY